jgi:hypothetical protein
VNRILVTYGGRDYVIGNRDIDEVEAEIAAGIDSGKVTWLDAYDGVGSPRACRLLLAPGVTISLVNFPHAPQEE